MATRTELVFRAAKKVYRAVTVGMQKDLQNYTEGQLWVDADEHSKQEYVFIAWTAWQSYMTAVHELGTISVGACQCPEYGLEPDRSDSRTCNTCGGRC